MFKSGDIMKIETERLLMRPYKLKDVDDIVEGLNDFDTAKNLTVPFPYTKENAKQFLNFVKQNKKDYDDLSDRTKETFKDKYENIMQVLFCKNWRNL